MNCKLVIETILDNAESKVLHKLLGELTVSMKEQCDMDDKEINILNKMYDDMQREMGQDVAE